MEWKKYTIESTEQVLDTLQVGMSGLAHGEVKRRLIQYGKNSIEEKGHIFFTVLKRRLNSLLLWVLGVVALITFIAGDYFETFFILLFLGINFSLEIYQEFHSERAAKLLQHYLVSEARVWRDGKITVIKTSLLVPGDLIELRAGDRIPADVRFLETESVAVDESIITGESIAVYKSSDALLQLPANILSVPNTGFAGTNMVAGLAKAVVIGTGSRSALGEVAHLTLNTEKETVFEKHVREFSRFLVKILLSALVLVFFLYFVIHGQSVSLVDMILFTLVLAITVVPEALPTITTVALTRGSLSLAKKKVVVKRLSAIEDLGSIEILCTDKTGTLTENHLTVVDVYGSQKKRVLSEALLASQVSPERLEDLHDSFDKALYERAVAGNILPTLWPKRIAELPFNPETRVNTVLVERNKVMTLIMRGSPEAILSKSHNVDAFTRKRMAEWIGEAGLRGERVLAIGVKENYRREQGLQVSGDLEFLGLISFLDPLKISAKRTIEEAKTLGVSVKVFSGDSKEVVGAVAYATGLITDPKDVITGAEFENFSLPEQIHALETGFAFARFSPEQKFGALRVLQKSHSVGFLGEGVNDAPALKLAHVALVVEGASDIAREASDILLLEKDLEIIIEGIKEGRKVFANILKYLKITLAANFGNFYSVTLAALFLPFLPLLPLQILLLNLLSDFPMLAIATDSVDQEKLDRPNAHNMHSIIVTATLFGAVSSFFDLTIFRIFSGFEPSVLQTAWFIFSLLAEVLLLYSLRTRRWFFLGEKSSKWVAILSLLAVCGAFLIPFSPLGAILSFQKLSLSTVGLLLGLLGLYFAVTEILKHWYYLHSPLFKER